ncbi:MAG: substrate-binding domain-containing protein [Saccharospirillum sp.]
MSPDQKRFSQRVSLVAAVLLLVLLASPVHLVAQTPMPSRVTILVNDLGNDYFQVLSRSVRRTALEWFGNHVRVTVVSSGYDVERQRQQLNSLMAVEPSLVVLSAADPNALSAEVQALQALGHIVIAVDVQASGALITITTDNWDAGYRACQHLARALNAKGKVALLDGPPVSSISERLEGCQQALFYFTNVEVVDRENSGASYVGGIEAMSRLMSRNPDLDGVFSINDPAALGASAAATLQGRTDLLIASVDGSPAFAAALRESEGPLLTSAAQFPQLMGARAIVFGLQMLRTGNYTPQEHRIPVQLITRDNTDEFCEWQNCAGIDQNTSVP